MSKTNWRTINKQRERTNNSVILLKKSGNKEQFEKIVNINNGTNDIGFVFANSWFDMFNPFCLKFQNFQFFYNGDLSKIDYEDISEFVKVNENLFGVQGDVI